MQQVRGQALVSKAQFVVQQAGSTGMLIVSEFTDLHRLACRFLLEEFGDGALRRGSGVLDVAGGKGEVSFELVNLNGIASTVIDPRPLYLTRFCRWLLVRAGCPCPQKKAPTPSCPHPSPLLLSLERCTMALEDRNQIDHSERQ